MKESYRKGVAIHSGSESCVASREAAIEALIGVHAGRGIELRNTSDYCDRHRARVPIIAVHPKPIMLRATQQPHPYQALARLCLVSLSLLILWMTFSK